MWVYYVAFVLPPILCVILFRKGKWIWIAPIFYLLFELITTIEFIIQTGSVAAAFTGEPGVFSATLMPLFSAWSLFCSLDAALIRRWMKQNKEGRHADKG